MLFCRIGRAVAGLALLPAAVYCATGFQRDYLNEFEYVSGHATALAAAMPASKYGWRPEKGVRSVSEVYVHMATGNYLLLDFVGVKPPADLYGAVTAQGQDRAGAFIRRNQELEKTITDQARVTAMLKDSLAAVRKAFQATSDADLEKPVKFFGRDSTVRAIYLRILVHLNEHTGQSVAYARMNRVTPPWSRASE
jgi:uncharacterized damage-inducible protein DinB